jgi:Fe-S-cluster-containing hydrogenase component 2
MPIKFNFNVCDNSPECSGKAVCATEAIYWDENGINALGEKGVLCIDNSKCTSCGQCVGDEGCPVGAIIFAQTEEELNELAKGIGTDPDKVKALFVDRYGAEPIDESICVTPDELENSLGSGITIVEEFAEWSIQCLLSSIPIESITQKVKEQVNAESVQFLKCDCSESKSEEDNLPALKVYKAGKLIACVDGYYDNDRTGELIAVLKKEIG